MIIDTHLHVVDPWTLDYPWLATVPALNQAWPYAAYELEARRAGISRTLHMEVDVAPERIEDETNYIDTLAHRPDSLIAGAIASCRPEEPEFAAYLDRQRRNPLVKGFRRVLHVMPDEVSEQPLFRDNIKRMSGSGLTFDLCMLPHQLPNAMALADLAPDVTFILDHCGVPDIKGDARQPWQDNITELARRPNVVAKISGVVAYADPDTWIADTLRPWVEHTISSFGWDRVVWGSDWPVCTLGGGLLAWVAATHALIDGASAEEKQKLLSSNARRIWSL
ncbi:amidohydrolase [Hoeflea sp. EC-HK425]|uniref:amidohydrolase family protein n=1 Tax=Hoeflea sp. EC-HK425 TaxID=2038388 RepID=UPI0012595722|nr:amidohydrolase [Hoeflea sp. EC-HK425]VVT24596.1 Predicted TIM-barrel fold metal-dependent hydrolase [Hoeflea sp. EC-HK425]